MLMILIYLLSNQTGKESYQLVVTLFPNLNPYILRKNAHFLIYFALSLFIFYYLNEENSLFTSILFALLFCGVYALTDELHQYTIGGRVASMKDFYIDFAGILTGLTLSFFITLFRSEERRVGKEC